MGVYKKVFRILKIPTVAWRDDDGLCLRHPPLCFLGDVSDENNIIEAAEKRAQK